MFCTLLRSFKKGKFPYPTAHYPSHPPTHPKRYSILPSTIPAFCLIRAVVIIMFGYPGSSVGLMASEGVHFDHFAKRSW